MTAELAVRTPGQLPDFPGAVIHSGLIYTSGIVDQLALSGGSPRSSAEQIRGAVEALVDVVERSGGDAAGIIRIEAYLASTNDLGAWASAFRERWPHGAPARTTLISQLALPTLAIELQAIAAQKEAPGDHD